jgi:excisionase family DNA binding protein
MGHHSSSPPVLPTEAESEMARVLARRIAAAARGGAVRLRLDEASGEEAVELPPVASRLVLDLLEELARGNAVTVTGVGAELTTQEAADLLNVSRPTLIQLLDEGKLPYRRLGTHRRIPLADVQAFKADLYAKRRDTLEALVAHDQALGLE